MYHSYMLKNIIKRYASINGMNKHMKSLVYAKKLDNFNANTQFISFSGPGTIDFVNGMVTTKLNEKFVKKNLTSLAVDDEDYEPPQTIKDLQNIAMSNHVAKELIDEYKFNANNMDEMDIRRRSLYDEQVEAYGNLKGQLTALLSSQSKVTTLMRLYTPLNTQQENIIVEVPKQQLNEDEKDHDVLAILEKHKKFKRNVKMIQDVQNDDDLGFDVWDVCFEGKLERSDMELETLSYILEDNKMNYVFNKKVHIDAHFKADDIIAVYFDDVLYNGSLLNDESHKVYYKYKVLVKKEKSHYKDFIHSFYNEVLNEDSVKEMKQIEQSFGLFDLCDIRPGSMLPFDLNLDYVPNSLSFDKGCYIGQELTTRMYSTDKITKRGVPIEIINSGNGIDPQVGWEVYTDDEIRVIEDSSENFNNVFGNSNRFIKKRKKPLGKLIIKNDETKVRLITLKTKYIDEIFVSENKTMKFYLAPSKEEIKVKGLDFEKCKIDINIKTPYWINEYLEE
ncbi:uncharacterized protein HGUI_04032 [Hanseniaspora guilliermondii]|uniref:Uncharacterized protein n=1 Tax=Hanseniaspora guilliermondii TaxID=56406 RepID=A0A1L0D3T4_9ASCO|nr:uncharacterized protein HGUI_04032 [Hanseniaspora guilliermondii]